MTQTEIDDVEKPDFPGEDEEDKEEEEVDEANVEREVNQRWSMKAAPLVDIFVQSYRVCVVILVVVCCLMR